MKWSFALLWCAGCEGCASEIEVDMTLGTDLDTFKTLIPEFVDDLVRELNVDASQVGWGLLCLSNNGNEASSRVEKELVCFLALVRWRWRSSERRMRRCACMSTLCPTNRRLTFPRYRHR